MPRRGFIQNQTTSEDAGAAATAWLPRDVLASILLRLPVSDLRRYRRVCKEWHEVILDPAFVDEYMDHGLQALTHTIAFFPGKSPAYSTKCPDSCRDFGAEQSENGAGYLLDEHWRVTARFMVSESEDMVGACNGLLCFLDVLQDAINIVDPFTGESVSLPLPPERERETETWRDHRHNHSSYCFGFDPSSRQYKILHLCMILEQGRCVYMYTIGEGMNWRSVHVERAAAGDVCGYPMIVNGAVYWSVSGKGFVSKLVRFDLATEEVTSALIELRRPFSPVLSVLGGSDATVSLMTREGRNVFIGVGTPWANCSTMRLHLCQHVSLPQALQRGHLMLVDHWHGRLYAYPIGTASNDLGLGNLVLQTACPQGPVTSSCSTRGLFVPVTAAEGGRRVPQKEINVQTYCYAPPLSPAPLARCYGKH